jgi:hypothetical protein
MMMGGTYFLLFRPIKIVCTARMAEAVILWYI